MAFRVNSNDPKPSVPRQSVRPVIDIWNSRIISNNVHGPDCTPIFYEMNPLYIPSSQPPASVPPSQQPSTSRYQPLPPPSQHPSPPPSQHPTTYCYPPPPPSQHPPALRYPPPPPSQHPPTYRYPPPPPTQHPPALHYPPPPPSQHPPASRYPAPPPSQHPHAPRYPPLPAPPPSEIWKDSYCNTPPTRSLGQAEKEIQGLQLEMGKCYKYIAVQENTISYYQSNLQQLQSFKEIQKTTSNQFKDKENVDNRLLNKLLENEILLNMQKSQINDQAKEIEKMQEKLAQGENVVMETNKVIVKQQQAQKRLENEKTTAVETLEKEKKATEDKLESEMKVAVETLENEKKAAEEKLDKIRDFVKQVNTDFQVGVEELTKKFGTSEGKNKKNVVGKEEDSSASTQFEDEPEVKILQENLNSLCQLVRETLEEFVEKTKDIVIESNEESCDPTSKIPLTKTVQEGDGESCSADGGDCNDVPSQPEEQALKDITMNDETKIASVSRTSCSSPPTLLPFNHGDHDDDAQVNNNTTTTDQKENYRKRKRSSYNVAHRLDDTQPGQCTCGYHPNSSDNEKNGFALKKHLMYQNSNIHCKLCTGRFVSQEKLKKHYTKTHKIPLQDLETDCDVCGLTYPTATDLNRHQNLMHYIISDEEYEIPVLHIVEGFGDCPQILDISSVDEQARKEQQKLFHFLCHRCAALFLSNEELMEHLSHNSCLNGTRTHAKKRKVMMSNTTEIRSEAIEM